MSDKHLEQARLLLLRYRSLYHTLTDTIEASDWILPTELDNELEKLYNEAGELLDETMPESEASDE